MYQSMRLPDLVQELVPKTPALPGTRNKAWQVHKVHRNETLTIDAFRILRRIHHAEVLADAFHAEVGNSMVGLDGRKGIVRNGNQCQGCSAEECALASVGLSDYSNLHQRPRRIMKQDL